MKIELLIAIVYSALLLSACAAMPGPQQLVSARANARMDLIMQGEVLEAYTYLSPGYRSSVSREAYMAQLLVRRTSWTSSELTGTECGENRCTVNFKIDYTIRSPVPGIRKFDFFSNIEENWIFTRGQWWYLPDN